MKEGNRGENNKAHERGGGGDGEGLRKRRTRPGEGEKLKIIDGGGL